MDTGPGERIPIRRKRWYTNVGSLHERGKVVTHIVPAEPK
jgi:hypothetical protein